MINLMPPEAKKELAAGRANRLLLRYLLLFAGLAVLIMVAIGFVYLFMSNTKATAIRQKEESENSARQLLAQQADITAFRSDLATAKQILDKQVNYSSIVLRVAGVIPDGVVINSLSLDPSTIGTSTSLEAQARSEDHLKRLKDALNASSYFTEAYYQTVTKAEGSESGYGYNAILNVTFTQELLDE